MAWPMMRLDAGTRIVVDCPTSMQVHVDRVLSGEYVGADYGLDLKITGILTIGDIGANVGAFTLWALRQWPNTTVTSYEPIPQNVDYLIRNLSRYGVENRVTVVPAAVYPGGGRIPLYLGRHNCGEASIFKGPESAEEVIEVEVIDPRSLPHFDLLKVDTEGAEAPIIGEYLKTHSPGFIAFEYHHSSDRRSLDTTLSSSYDLCAGSVNGPYRGTLLYVRRNLLPERK